MNLLTIGTSWITESFLESAEAAGFTHYAVYSRAEATARAFAEKRGAANVFTSLDAAAACGEIDCVYIASPNVFHFEQAKRFLERKKHVIVEKPICTYPAQLRELYGIADANGVVLAEALMPLHADAANALAQAVLTIGTIRSAHLQFCQLSSKYNAYLAGERPNIFRPELHAGCLQDLGVYAVCVAYMLFGAPRDVKASAVMLPEGADACGAAVLDYGDRIVTLDYSKTAQARAPSQILGDRGAVLIDSVSQLTGIRAVYNDGSEQTFVREPSRFEVMRCEATDFLAYINHAYEYVPYAYARRASLGVAEIMEKIRNACGNFQF